MNNSTIWVLVANEREASISANTDGISSPLLTLRNESPDRPVPDSRCGFACTVMLELCRGALAHAYDGLIIVADDAMMNDLRMLIPANVADLLIARLGQAPGRTGYDISWQPPAQLHS